MARIYRNLIIVLVALVVSLYALYPPATEIRLGKDLRGGTSLTYAVQIKSGEDAERIISETISVLKNRVDPQGMFEISMVRQGRDRIEISMPLPGPEVKALRAALEDELAKLARTELSEGRILQTMRLPGEQRSRAIDELSIGDAGRKQLLTDAATKFDRSAAVRGELDRAQKAGEPQERIDALVASAADAELGFDESRDAVLRTAISPAEVRRVLQLSNRPRIIADEKGKAQSLPSPRERALTRLDESHPEAKAQLDRILSAHRAYEENRKSLDDPQDLIRLLRGAGVLSFRITIDTGAGRNAHPDEEALRGELRERGPRNATRPDARWFKINQIENWYDSVTQLRYLEADPVGYFAQQGFVGEEYDGEYYILCWDTRKLRLTPSEGRWRVNSAFEGVDQVGRPAIDFVMDERGATLLGELTREPAKTNLKMAVLLDDEVYTAPSLRSQISGNGQITGSFSEQERRYIIRVLAAGSLQAKLSPEPIAVSTLGPELGADNLRKGFEAGVIALIVISGFMIVYYFGCGFIAVFALFTNAVLLMAAMAANNAAFTMPGIAGVILTFGMAVDSNVLIYERMREELQRGNDLKTAVRLGFSRALDSIVDGNITNLIVCLVLGQFGTEEIKGFAITMGIGVLSTLFCAIVATRVIFDLLVFKFGWRKALMLPMVVPVIQRGLTPNVNWIKYRFVFFGISAAYVLLGLGMVVFKGEEMLSIEFRGGTQVTLQFREGERGQPLTMTRRRVEERVMAIGNAAPANSQLRELRTPEVITMDPAADGVTSDRFIVNTIATDSRGVQAAVVDAFADVLDVRQPLVFAGSDLADFRQGSVYRVLSARLGDNIDRPAFREDVAKYIGGVAIVLEGLTPPPTLHNLEQRFERVRVTSDYSATLNRVRQVVVLEGGAEAVRSAAVLVRDEQVSLFDNETRWEEQVAQLEWSLVLDALTRSQTLAGVQSISGAVAESFQANAIVSVVLSFLLIGIYIWARFKSVRYSLAAIIALLHDCLTVIGLVALAEIMWDHEGTKAIAQSLGILPFKIDLNLMAAILTIAGYSLNDTIIIMDRIRENRGKGLIASQTMVNNAVNQTISRTVITAGTTLFSCITLYLVGGEGMRAFAFALTIGVAVGTYSSVAVAAPIVWSRRGEGGSARA
ncbi:MAG: protein translocase subunit SecD [Phycisphaerae bacterium]|nr:protein translocase subunit SecD [Phycisphaerae bacterium]